MEHTTPDMRLKALEHKLQLTQVACALLLLCGVIVLTTSMGTSSDVQDEVRTHRLVLVDDKGVTRLELGQDPVDAQRRSRSAGLTIYDDLGNERGGFGTFDDGSVVFAMDAPVGVGAPMRDRIGLVVWPDGSSHVMLLDNATKAVAKLHSDGAGNGGLQVFDWNDATKKIQVKTIGFKGEEITTRNYGE